MKCRAGHIYGQNSDQNIGFCNHHISVSFLKILYWALMKSCLFLGKAGNLNLCVFLCRSSPQCICFVFESI